MILSEKTLGVSRAMLESAHIPENFWSLQLRGNPQTPEVYAQMQSILATLSEWLFTNQGVLINGLCGAGKTSYGCILLRQAMAYSARCLFVYAAEVPAIWDKPNPSSGQIYHTDFHSADLLLLDDLGQEDSISKFDGQKKVEFIIRSRYDAGRPTVATSNYTIPELIRRHGVLFEGLMRRAFPNVLSFTKKLF
jgi:DNA replication protein DnaC